MWSSKFKVFLASALRITSATTVVAAEIEELSAQIGLVPMIVIISQVVVVAARLSQQRQGRGGRHPWSPKESVWVTFQQTDLLLFAQLTDPVKVLK